IFSAVQFYPARRLDPAPIFREPDTAPPVPDRKWTSFGSRTAQSGKNCSVSAPPGVFAVVQFAAEAQRRGEPNSDRRGPKLAIRHQLAHRDTPPGPCFSNLTASRN